ncbi:hypothetical protein LTS18_001099, partial [Coniosporium uncinatum]
MQLFAREKRGLTQERADDLDEALANIADFSRLYRHNLDQYIDALIIDAAPRMTEYLDAIMDETDRGRPIPWSRESFVGWEAWGPREPEDDMPTPTQLAVRAII